MVGVSTLTQSFIPEHNKDTNALEIVEHRQHDRQQSDWLKRARLAEEWYSRRGVIIGRVEVLVEVVEFQKMEQMVDGSLTKSFAPLEASTFFPLQQILERVEREDTRFRPSPALSLDTLYPLKREIIYVDPYFYREKSRTYFGVMGSVVDYDHDSIVVKLSVTPRDALDLAKPALDRYYSVPFFPLNVVCKKVGLSRKVLSKITSKTLVSTKGSQNKSTSNIGLDLKFEGRQLKVDGYTKRTDAGWSFSDAAISLLADYAAAFPLMFSRLHALEDKDEVLQEVELFGLQSEPETAPAGKPETLPAVLAWLKSRGVRSLVQVPVDYESFNEQEVHAIEEAQDVMNQKIKSLRPFFETYTVTPGLLMKPGDNDVL